MHSLTDFALKQYEENRRSVRPVTAAKDAERSIWDTLQCVALRKNAVGRGVGIYIELAKEI